ncbi:unnamed protein product [Rotaria socialis]|uniref:TIR domain-containing protein n=1 Tax=Rotaria socialis TaxID=392032 RepID=A0A820NAG9_9BILA|nr:unnamed protein product [Rotaria socialis]CAF4385426.1 unnamed protein product [Rotaria socialis]CAF4438966.1 unnamed protein product [Rotaria socialis]CAF4810039.1 unnamed protein product [Rotaria socialis]
MHNALLCHIENPDVFLFVNITFGFCLELASLEFRDKAKQQFEREMHEEKVINHNEDMRMAKQQEKFSYILAMKKKTALELIGYQPRRNRDSGNFVVQPVRNVQIPNLVRSDSIPKPPSKSAAEYDSVEVATTSSCCWQSHGPDNSKLPNVRSGIGLNSQAKPHLMISYQWDSQDLCKKIYERLLSDAYVVWFDVVNMHGCIYTAMAEAVETSEIILCGMTQKYKDSTNCHKEATYACKRGKRIIPIRLQQKYNPDGWLSLISSDLLYIDFIRNDFDTNYKKLLDEIKSGK